VDDENYITELEGPVELVDGELMLCIPLASGGDVLLECARGISEVVGDEVHIRIPQWLAEKLGIFVGSTVVVNNRDDKFTIMLVPEPEN
jgi:hypothetical protein